MSKRPPSGNVDVRLGSGTQASGEPLDPEMPFRLLVLGDFGGAGSSPLATLRLHAIDRDVLEEELEGLQAAMDVPLGGGQTAKITLRDLDDFHPDRLLERVDALTDLRKTRARLENPATFREAAGEVRGWAGPPPARREGAAATAPASAEDDVVGELLAGASRRAKAADSAFEDELKAIVRPHLAPEEDADLPRLKEAVDEARAGLLRAILRSPRFRELEAAWRTLDLLVRRVGDESVRVFFLDVSRAALVEDISSHEKLSGTGLYRRLVTETLGTPGAEPWGAVLGLYDFGPTLADAALLSRIAKIAQAAGAPFLAGARPDLVGCASLAGTPDPDDWKKSEDDGAIIWEELRVLPETSWVALALPRLMLRLPYGAKTDPIDAFPFEEIPDAPDHDAYLWGNAAVACALVLTRAFELGGWDLKPETAAEIRGLPAHVFKDGLETRVTPPSEVVLTLRAAERILEAGLVPVLSLKGSESVRVARLQPIASPLRALAGRWLR
ncbi:MAG: type VI secretion system contractile sheath large subunit [Acidobacteriota bacterium]